MRVRRLLLLGCLGWLASCSDDGTLASQPTPPTWSVQSGFIRDAQGRAVILRGANVSGGAKAPPWFGFQGPADFLRMRTEWGMNAVRFLVEWAPIEPESGVYDASYLDGVAERIGWAQDADLAVVVDMHQDIYGMGFAAGGGDGAPLWSCAAGNYAGFMPMSVWALDNLEAGPTACWDAFWNGAAIESHFAEAWRRVAARLSGYGNVVGFDVFNEPYWGSHGITHFEPDLLSPFYEKIVPVVRSAAPAWLAFLEPSSARNLGGTTYLTRPTFGQYVYAPHSYDTDAEMGDGFPLADVPKIVSNIAALASEAQALGGPLWIGEYGGTASESGITEYMKATYDGAGAVAASTMYWAYDMGGYGLLNPDGTEAQPLVDSVVRPYPERVAGDPIAWSFDEPSSTFTFRYHPSASIAAPTIVSVPPRIYPGGYSVDCGGCKSSVIPGSLIITAPAGADPAVVTLTPSR